jgi:hypothetical protein
VWSPAELTDRDSPGCCYRPDTHDLLIVPLGLPLSIKMIPSAVMTECRSNAELLSDRPTSRTAARAIIGAWALIVALVVFRLLKVLNLR